MERLGVRKVALRIYKNKETGEVKKSLKTLEEPWEEILVPPSTKFMEMANPATGKSKEKGLTQILTARARNYARDVDLDDTIRINRENGLETSVKLNLLNDKGQRRRKIDDI